MQLTGAAGAFEGNGIESATVGGRGISKGMSALAALFGLDGLELSLSWFLSPANGGSGISSADNIFVGNLLVVGTDSLPWHVVIGA